MRLRLDKWFPLLHLLPRQLAIKNLMHTTALVSAIFTNPSEVEALISQSYGPLTRDPHPPSNVHPSYVDAAGLKIAEPCWMYRSPAVSPWSDQVRGM